MMNICKTVLSSGARKGGLCGRLLRSNGTCIYPSHKKNEQVYTPEVMTNIESNQYQSDVEIDISLPSDYDSESDSDSDVSDDSYISDGDELDISNGYESDHNDPYDYQNEMRIKNCESDINESNISEADMLWKENIAALQAQSRLENIKISQQIESNPVKRYEDESKYVKQIEIQVSETESESDNEYEHTVLPTKEYLDINKTFSEAEMADFRSNKYYKLASIFTNESLSKMVDGQSNHSRLLFAFKNEESFNDNIVMFMLREILSKNYSSWSDLNESFLSMNVSRKVYGDNYSKQLINTKWPQIKKIAKDLHPTEYQLWENDRLSNERKVKAKAIVNNEKFQHTVYQFINKLKAPKDPIVTCNKLYEQYQKSFAQPHTITTFGRMMSKYGLKSKKIKTNKCYQITTESIKLWLDSYQE
jgi:hypothetical protein